VAAIALLWRLIGGGAAVDSAPLLVLPALGAAVIIGNSTGTMFGELEKTVSRPLVSLRLMHLIGLLSLAALGLMLANGSIEPAVVRNVAGLAGIAFLMGRLVGAGLSWISPLLYGMYVLAAGSPGVWEWPIRASGDAQALLLATSLAGFGLAVIALYGARAETE
jgi:hypothetical protein